MKLSSRYLLLIIIFLILSCNKVGLNVDQIDRLPQVSTFDVTNVSNNSALLSGQVTKLGTSEIVRRGFCYGKNPNPDMSSSIIQSGSGEGQFNISINGLERNMIYYVRAFAENNMGLQYGNQMSFTTTNISANLPSVSTSTVTNITENSASSGGNITSNGGAPITGRGICYSTNAGPTLADNVVLSGTGTGGFISNLTGLTPFTTYFVRAFATNAAGTAFGNEVVFSTTNRPYIETKSVSSITSSSAISGGRIISDGGSPITEKGVCWNTSPNPTISLNTKTIDGSGIDSFNSNILGLIPFTSYYVRAYATNANGTVYGNEINFTSTTLPVISTKAISNITANGAISGGDITSDGGTTITSRGVCWSTSVSPTIALSTKTNDGSDIGSFISNLTGLAANCTYYVRAFATNINGTTYGNELSFTTPLYSFVNGPNVTDIDGNVYSSITNNCGQTWTTKNLTVSRYRNGDIIPQVTDPAQWVNLTTGAWCWYNNDSSNYWQYGKLYNWYALNDSRGLAPVGWHLPSDADWNKLTKCINRNSDTTISYSNEVGAAMKSTYGWANGGIAGTNSSGFNGFPGGFRWSTASFSAEGGYGYWWSINDYSLSEAWCRYLGFAYIGLNRSKYDKRCGFSVRCIRD